MPALDRHPEAKIVRLQLRQNFVFMLHLLDAPGRDQRFLRQHADLVDRLPKKGLASYLNLSPETLSRLKRHGKI